MGLHTGTPQVVGDHYVGLDVHRAARIAAAGHGGQILLSQATRELVAFRVPTLLPGATLRAVGAHRLKDLQEPEPIFQLVLPGLSADFPPLKTLDTYQHNLPVQPTPLLDRVEPLVALTTLLRSSDVRLVTLTGPGGIGKTRLAIQPIAETLRARLAEKRLLLVLDNFEQVIGAAGELANLLAASPGLRGLVSSRTPLRLRGEREYALGPLPLPAAGIQTPERLAQYAAVALFIERAQAARADFTVTATNAPAIAAICAQLDGLPLAIELAAARVKVLPTEALLARLSAQLTLLTGGARDLEERQQTMRAAIAWSEALLTPDDRALFRRLAVFAGGTTLEAAETVCAGPTGAEPLGMDVLDGLSALVDQSLLQQREEGGEPRFGMLHTIREYALERLEASGEAAALRQAHAVIYLALAERAEPELTGPEQRAWLNHLEREHDNLRAALGWAREQGDAETGLRLAAALRRFWEGRGHLREGRAWVEEPLALQAAHTAEAGTRQAVSVGVRARALLAGGRLANWQGDNAAAEPWLEQAVALGREVGDQRTAAEALNVLAIIALERDDPAQADARFNASLALARAARDPWGASVALNNLGDVAVRQGDLARAEAVFAEALPLAQQLGDRSIIGVVVQNLSWVARKRGALAESEALAREALALTWEVGDPRQCAEGLEYLAATAGAAGQGERAARLWGAAAAIRAALGSPLRSVEQAELEQEVAPARAALGEAAWATAFAAGQALSLEAAVAEALDAAS